MEKQIPSLNDFIEILKNNGSDLSADINTNLLNGVKGMPVTHQTGFGNAWRKGRHPNSVDVDIMNTETHIRMTAAGLGLSGGRLLKEKDAFANILGVISLGFGAYQLRELYQDWKAGFEAAKYLGPKYSERMASKRNNNLRPVKRHRLRA